jgi:HD-like signal output (HDOD) protein
VRNLMREMSGRKRRPGRRGATVDAKTRLTCNMNRSKESTFLLSYYPGSLQDLPLISPVAIDAAALACTGSLSLQALTEAIVSDVFLSAKIVSVANSVFFNLAHTPCLTVQESLERVGIDFATALLKNTTPVTDPVSRASAERLWLHCATTAGLAQALATQTTQVSQSPEAVYWIAMIHDIGLLIEANFEHNHFSTALSEFEQHEILNTEHCVLAQSLALHWALPSWVIQILRWHHEPSACQISNVEPLINLLNIAHVIGESKEADISAQQLSTAGLSIASVMAASQAKQQLIATLTSRLKH